VQGCSKAAAAINPSKKLIIKESVPLNRGAFFILAGNYKI